MMTNKSYGIGIICALAVEKAAVESMLDEEHTALQKKLGDDNDYTFGRIGVHNVVVAALPSGAMGKSSAAVVAKDLMRSFEIKVGLMVGICGGAPSAKADIRLGDIIVSSPDGQHGGVVQWDFGKMEKGDVFRRTGTLDKPPKVLLHAIQSLRTKHYRKASMVSHFISDALDRNPVMSSAFGCPGPEKDQLFQADYDHPHGLDCQSCSPAHLVQRVARDNNVPSIHYGNIGSGDEVVKSGRTRDRLAAAEGFLCFEMEAAGLMDTFPCVVIRGVCDYADSHKNKQWQPYAAMCAAAFAKELLGTLDKQELGELQPLEQYIVPLHVKSVPNTHHFCAREAELAQLETFFFAFNQGEKGQKMFVVHGMGGIGKTQLCAKFIRKHQERFSAIFWIDGSSKNELLQSLVVAESHLPGSSPIVRSCSPDSEEDMQLIADRFLRWLSAEHNSRWLLVFDNIDRECSEPCADPEAFDVHEYIPSVDHGHILVTSRSSRWQSSYSHLNLRAMSEAGARELLKRHVGKDIIGIDHVLDRLHGLPLALVQAGSFLRRTGISTSEYRDMYDKTWTKLMEQQSRYQLQQKNERSVLTTWKMSYDQVKRLDEQAALLLDQWAFLANEGVDYEIMRLFQPAASISIVAVQRQQQEYVAHDKLSFYGSLSILSDFSMVILKNEGQEYYMHPVLHKWAKSNVAAGDRQLSLCRRAIKMVAENAPSPSFRLPDWKLSRRMLPHAKAAAIQYMEMSQRDEADKKIGRALHMIAKFISSWDSSPLVEQLYLHVIDMTSLRGDGEHTSTLDTINNLGSLYSDLGRMHEAEKMYLRALEGKEKAWGAEHTSTLDTVNNLGILYKRLGRMQEAEKMYLRALEGYEKAWGAEHSSTLGTVNNLGNLYKSLGRMQEAEKMYLQALEGYERAEGNHEDTLAALRETLSALRLSNIESVHSLSSQQKRQIFTPLTRSVRAKWGKLVGRKAQ